ncbi:ADP-ribosylation factor family-domain-containing protein [Crepidotus variabilis]|uniref:ADP-ribosylation factor n=1 Tax=Crepidotus variabilis TaxID=179855 RepID=A0A9P6EA55_9AGAR|nr:ADP-ribosylation factor family-domain-containing protein [Crepidotus variabilis]
MSFAHHYTEIVMVGPDKSGTTSLLNRLKRKNVPKGVLPATIPTIGSNIETIRHERHTITIWEFGGQDKIRPLWRFYYWNAHAFIFVVDASAPERFAEAGEELSRMPKSRDIARFPLLILANKWDLVKDDTMDLERIRKELRVEELEKLGMVVGVMAASAMTGAGISEALDWVVERVSHELINSHNEDKKHVIQQQ